MALFECTTTTADSLIDNLFPTEPAFLVSVEVRPTANYGDGHYGVFALEPIKEKTKFWMWTDRIVSIHYEDLRDYIFNTFGDNREEIQVFLRQGFVLPSNPNFFNSNPTDAGRFMNHSSTPNCGPDGTLRDIEAGEELTMDYSFHGNPEWYQEICHFYDVLTEAEVAMQFS
jgi:hypothetical protein